MKKQTKKTKLFKQSRISNCTLPLRMLAGFEGLEPRQMLAANVLDSGEAILPAPGSTQDVEFLVSIPDGSSSTTAVLLISVAPTSGSSLDPATPVVTADGGGTVTPLRSFTQADAVSETIVVAVPAGNHSIQVAGEGNTSGGYAVSVSLAGDVDVADQQVSEFEEMMATAAFIQASGTGNFVTNHFYWVNGIDTTQDLYDAGFDTNGNGTIDSVDIQDVRANVGIGSVSVELRVDDEGPVFGDVQLVNDTGVSDTDGITTDPSVRVNVTDASPIARLEGALDGGAAVVISGLDLNSGAFTISQANLDTVAGGTLSDGPHTLTLTATDDLDNSSSTSIDFTFIRNNSTPVANAIAGQTATEDSVFTFDVSSSFSDADAGDFLTFSGNSLPGWLTANSQGILSGTPRNDDVGSTNVSVTATDTQGASVSATIAINVLNTNDAPILTQAIPNQDADEDDAFSFDFRPFFSDPDGDNLSFSAVQGTNFATGVALPAWLSDSDGVLSGNPTAADAGVYNIAVTAVDPTGASVETTFQITVTNLNDAPTLLNNIDDQNTTEDQPFSLDISPFFDDEDPGDTITFSISNLPSWLSLGASSGLLTGTPGDNDVGTTSLTVQATDSFGASTSDTFNITVTNVNDAPVLDNQNFTVDPAATNGTVVGTIVVNDPDPGDSFTIAVLSGDPNGIFAVNATTGVITVADASGLVDGAFVNLNLEVTDEAGETDTGTAQIAISSNFAPVAVNDDAGSVFDNKTLDIDVLSNDTDPDGDSLSVQSVDATSAEGASLTINADGTITYDPRLVDSLSGLGNGQNVTDSFEYVVSDGEGGFDTGTVTVTVTGTDVAEYRLEVINANGNVVNTVSVGDTFTLVAYVRDVQQSPEGVFSAYIDVDYPAALATPDGAIVHSSTYPSGTSGTNTTPGLLDEVGGVDGLTPLGGNEFEVFRQQFTASAPGSLDFQSNATEDQVQHPTLIFNDNVNLPTNQIIFGSTTVSVTGAAPPLSDNAGAFSHNAVNPYDVNGDGAVSPLDALLAINAFETGVAGPNTFPDVNGDSAMSPIDPLLVINELVEADGDATADNGGVQSDVSQAELQSAFDFVFEELEDDDLTISQLANLDSSLIVAILQVVSADASEQDGLWDQLAADLAAALSD